MTSPDQTKKVFLLGSIGLGALIIIGLMWAVASGPGTGGGGGSINFDDSNDPVFGPATSTVTVRVFGDFQCPACRSAEPAFLAMKQKYADLVRFVWNDFPLQSIHPNSLPAANAARCAEAQGKFWDYHDKLYADQPSWDTLPEPRDKFIAYANALDMNTGEFTACFDERRYESKIMDDLREGNRNNVNATPTFFVNDFRMVGVIEPAAWEREIQARLK